MIQMSVGSQQVNGLELLLTDIVINSLQLFWIVGTTIDDDTLTTVITHHIAILLQRVYWDTLDVEH
jgi:hypothetical protein